MKMKRGATVSFLLFTVISAGLVLTGCNGNVKKLSVQLYAQQTTNWCWAASGEMIMNYHGTDVDQCLQADNRQNRNDCCDNPTPQDCILGGWPQFNLYGFTFSSTASGTALTWQQLKDQIDDNKPVGFSWAWTGGGGHYMVAIGYSDSGPIQQVAINDPWPWNTNKFDGGTAKLITYDEYVSSSSHTHLHDDYNITKQ